MTEFAGRTYVVKMGDGEEPEEYDKIAGMRETGLSINNSAIDVSSKDSSQFTKLISGGMKSLDISLSGIMSDDATIQRLIAAVLATDGSDIQSFRLESSMGDSFAGRFFIESFSRNGAYTDAEVYDLKLKSADVPEYTAPA